MQRDIAVCMIQIRRVIDFLDDGHHRRDVKKLEKINRKLFNRLNEQNKDGYLTWLAKRYAAK